MQISCPQVVLYLACKSTLANQGHSFQSQKRKPSLTWFSSRLPIQKVCTCANRALDVLTATAKAAHGFLLSVFSHLYEACVIPICAYPAHVWANRKRQPLEKIHKMHWYTFGLRAATPLAALLRDSGWPAFQLHLQFTIVKCWFWVCSMPLRRIPKQAFLWSCSVSESGRFKVTWALHASDLLD